MSISLRTINEDDLEMIMIWRMSDDVTKFMNTNPKLTIDSQRKWLKSIQDNERVRNWIVEIDGEPAGLICLIDINWKDKNTSWGYYIGEKRLRSLKCAISLEMSLYDYCFDVLGFKEVHNDVFEINDGVWKLHIACGCKIIKEKCSEIEKEGITYKTLHLSIEGNEWIERRKGKKYEHICFDFFNDCIADMVPHHLGVAVADINNSISKYKGFGWIWDGKLINDDARSVSIAFLKRNDSPSMLELISPMTNKSPVSHLLESMKNVATPYHMCYVVSDIQRIIEVLKMRGFVITDRVKPAKAFNNRRVAFLLSREVGLIELLEEEKD